MNTQSVPLVHNQRWKLRVAFAMVLVGGMLMWFDRQLAELLSVSRYMPTLIGTFLGLVTLLFAVAAVRCPSCKTSLVWFALSKKSSGSWLVWLLDESTCPKCHYSAPRENDAENAL